MADNNCHECGQHCVDCKCDKNEKCSKCDKIRMKWSKLCFECAVYKAKNLLRKSTDFIPQVEDE